MTRLMTRLNRETNNSPQFTQRILACHCRLGIFKPLMWLRSSCNHKAPFVLAKHFSTLFPPLPLLLLKIISLEQNWWRREREKVWEREKEGKGEERRRERERTVRLVWKRERFNLKWRKERERFNLLVVDGGEGDKERYHQISLSIILGMAQLLLPFHPPMIVHAQHETTLWSKETCISREQLILRTQIKLLLMQGS